MILTSSFEFRLQLQCHWTLASGGPGVLLDDRQELDSVPEPFECSGDRGLVRVYRRLRDDMGSVTILDPTPALCLFGSETEAPCTYDRPVSPRVCLPWYVTDDPCPSSSSS